jgi:hypothetical protein
MRASRRWLAIVLACAGNFFPSFFPNFADFADAQSSDQIVAERVLGPQWRQISRRAGMIFAGTVLTSVSPMTNQTAPADPAAAGTIPASSLSFRVDEPIAGVKRGQVVTIHEWAGAWARHRPMSKGQHILIFLYPPSRLGLTSPVDGALGQIALDASGKNVVERKTAASTDLRDASLLRSRETVAGGSVSVLQLAGAIRSARRDEARSKKEE